MELFVNTNHAKTLLQQCCVCLDLGVSHIPTTGVEFLSPAVTLYDFVITGLYPEWINIEAFGIEVIRYAELCTQFLKQIEQREFYSNYLQPYEHYTTEIERMVNFDAQTARKLRSLNVRSMRSMTTLIRSNANIVRKSLDETIDIREPLVIIDFLLSALKLKVIQYLM